MMGVSLTRPKGFSQWLRLYKLYRSAFPASERKPFFFILKMYRKGKFDIWRIEKDGQALGLAITVGGSGLVLVDYLAIEKPHRGRGAGTAALNTLREKYPGKGIFLEIESVYEDAPDRQARLRRKQFYLRCGMKPMQVMIDLFGVKMELLCYGCKLTYEDYHSFYRDNIGVWAAGHIARENHPGA